MPSCFRTFWSSRPGRTVLFACAAVWHAGSRNRRNKAPAFWVLALALSVFLASCSRSPRDLNHLLFLIESNPANLDPRFSTDAQSQRIDRLLFDGLVERDAQMNLHPDLAESWETPDSFTYIFHLRKDVHFHDGRPVTAKDVQSTFAFMMNPANKSPKGGAFKMIRSIETPEDHTIVFHLNEPAASFLWNLERSAVGIVPAGAGPDFFRKLIGSGPFRFVSQSQDDSVVLEKNPDYFRGAPKLDGVTFRIVPDAIVRALELATLFSDLNKGNFQLSYARWVGANNDPDFFALVFSSKRVPPNGANRGRYRSSRLDELTDAIRVEMDPVKRKQLTCEAQKLAATDLPYIPLWYNDIVSVHQRRFGNLQLSPTGDYEFLSTPN